MCQNAQGALVAGAMIGGTAGYVASRPPEPTYYRHGHGRYKQVTIVQQAPPGQPPIGAHEMLVLISCPHGVRPGDPLEIEVDGRAFLLTVSVVLTTYAGSGSSYPVRLCQFCSVSLHTVALCLLPHFHSSLSLSL